MNRLLFAVVATGVGTTIGVPAQAQEGTLEEIVVTAQRREETLQSAPIALSVASAEDLERAHVVNSNQLMTVIPALQTQSAGITTNFYIRGVGSLTGNAYADPGVAFNYDGIYVGRPSSAQGFFYDLQRVEVLKGPQGTLYGRNTTGGAVNVLPRLPEIGKFSGYFTGEVGNYELTRAQGALNIPAGEKSAFRVAGQIVDRDGYFDDGLDDDESEGARIMFLTEPSDVLSIRLATDYYHRGGKGFGSTIVSRADPVFGPGGAITGYTFSDTGISRGAGLHNAATDALWSSRFLAYAGLPGAPTVGVFPAPYRTNERNDNDYWGVNAEVNWQTDAGTVTITPAYRRGELDYLNHAAGFGYDAAETDRQKSLEVRLASDTDQSLSYIFGAYYFDEDATAEYSFNTLQFLGYQPLETGVESVAAFSRLTWELTPGVRLNGGVRYTRDKRYMDGVGYVLVVACAASPVPAGPVNICPGGSAMVDGTPSQLGLAGPPFVGPPVPIAGTSSIIVPGASYVVDRGLTDDAVTWRVGAEWDVASDSMIYAGYETGFRSGGFFFTPDDPTFGPERINAFTLGSKNRFLDNRLQVNLEAFYWKYKDQQVSHFSTASTGQTIFVTENVGRSVNKGGEIETQYLLTDNTLLKADVQYLHARYKDFVYNAANIGVPPVNGCPATLAGATYTIDCSGRTPPKAPEWTLNLGVEQTIELGGAGSLVASLDTRYQSETLVGTDYTPNEVEDAYWMSAASLTYETSDARWSVTAFVNNIEDERVATSVGNGTALNLFAAQFLPPRTYGLRATAKF